MIIRRPKNDNARGQAGFSMIEVLVTIAIVAFGLMGLLALMLKGLQANAGSSMRTIATAQAYDIADRMRANLTGVQAGNYNATIPPGSTSTCPIPTSGNISPPTAASLAALGTCAPCDTACSSADVAARDSCNWHKANASFLPSGSGAVCREGTSNKYAIYVSWDDNKTGNPDKTFILRFEP